MKIIHTSDWHLGQTLHNYERSREHAEMLRQITEIVRAERPDALVVSGDIFDSGNPPVKAVEMYNRAMLEMHDACPTMEIVVTAGNHDSASRLAVNNDLWEYFRVTVVGNVARSRDALRVPDYDAHIVDVKDPAGNLVGYIAAVPHCYESNFPTADPSLQREERMRAYFAGLSDAVAARNPDHLPVVLMAHLAVDGCDFSGHDNVGGMEKREVDVFGDGYDYVALGHIHSPHSINSRVRYCGTPIAVNFGERHAHSVSVVTLAAGADPVVETREIENPVPLRDFPAEPLPLDDAIDALADIPADEDCYLRLLVRVDTALDPLAYSLVAEALKDKKCRLCKIQTFTKPAERQQNCSRTRLTGGELRTRTPLEIAEMFFEMKGITLTDRQKEMIKEATIAAEKAEKGDTDEA